MVKNFHDVIASMQVEIDQSLAKLVEREKISAKRYLLEKAASEMLRGVHLQHSKSQGKQTAITNFN